VDSVAKLGFQDGSRKFSGIDGTFEN